MNKKIILSVIAALVIGAAAGFIVGQEYTKHRIVKSISEAFSDTSSSAEEKREESQSLTKQVEQMKNISAEIGDTVELATLKYVVNSAEEKDMIKSSYGQPHVAEEGTKFIVVDVTVTNRTPETFSFDHDTFKIQTSDGVFYDRYSDAIGNIDNHLAWEDLSPNIAKTGVVVFQLPSQVEEYDLIAKKANSNDLYRVRLK